MPKKKLTLENVKERLNIINPNIIILSEKYVNNKTKLKCICSIDNYLWEARADNLLSGFGCPKCAIKSTSDKQKSNLEEVKKILKEINPNIQITSTEYKNNRSKLKCKCLIDGNEWETKAYHLIHSKSGCPKCSETKLSIEYVKKKLFDINSDIQILSDVYIGVFEKIKCNCKKCNYIWEVSTNHLLNAKTGCPNCCSSKGEIIISNWLTKNKIEFIKEYKFADCKHKYRLRFDFYIPSLNAVIEYDGIQHYKNTGWDNHEEKLLRTQKNDNIKNNYCNINNIKLLRIPYWEKDNINTMLQAFIQIK